MCGLTTHCLSYIYMTTEFVHLYLQTFSFLTDIFNFYSIQTLKTLHIHDYSCWIVLFNCGFRFCYILLLEEHFYLEFHLYFIHASSKSMDLLLWPSCLVQNNLVRVLLFLLAFLTSFLLQCTASMYLPHLCLIFSTSIS